MFPQLVCKHGDALGRRWLLEISSTCPVDHACLSSVQKVDLVAFNSKDNPRGKYEMNYGDGIPVTCPE